MQLSRIIGRLLADGINVVSNETIIPTAISLRVSRVCQQDALDRQGSNLLLVGRVSTMSFIRL